MYMIMKVGHHYMRRHHVDMIILLGQSIRDNYDDVID